MDSGVGGFGAGGVGSVARPAPHPCPSPAGRGVQARSRVLCGTKSLRRAVARCSASLAMLQPSPPLRLLAPAPRSGSSLRLLASALRFGVALLLLLLRAGARALQRGPWGAAGGGRTARRVGRRDAAKVFDRPGMACPKTPTDSREPFAHGCAKGADEGWPFFGLPFFGHAKKGRSGRPKDGPKALALRFQQRCDEASKQHRGERGAHGGPRPTL